MFGEIMEYWRKGIRRSTDGQNWSLGVGRKGCDGKQGMEMKGGGGKWGQGR